jgi:hypothetical protein
MNFSFSLPMYLFTLTAYSEKYCHKFYASSMIGYGVDPDAPRYPFVIPTLLHRNLLYPIINPLWALLSWVGRAAYSFFFEGDEIASSTTKESARRFATKMVQFAQETFEADSDYRMSDDEIM